MTRELPYGSLPSLEDSTAGSQWPKQLSGLSHRGESRATLIYWLYPHPSLPQQTGEGVRRVQTGEIGYT